MTAQIRNPFDEVLYNDLLLDKIFSYINDVDDVERAKRSCHRLKNFHDKPMTTLSLVKIVIEKKNYLEVKFGEKKRILKLEKNEITENYLAKILQFVPKAEISLIKKVIIKGIPSGYKDKSSKKNMIGVDLHLGTFLDEFVGMTHFELIGVALKENTYEIERLFECQFIQRLTSLTILDSDISGTNAWKLVGRNVNDLHFTERMISLGDHYYLKIRKPSIANVTIHLDDKNWTSKASTDSRTFIQSNCHVIPWHLMYEKKIEFNGDRFIPVKHRKDLRHLTLRKMHRQDDEDVILRTISEMRHLPLLNKVTIDGYFSRTEMQKFIQVLKKCYKVTVLELRMRSFTENPEDWIMLIEHLPKRIFCVKFDGIVDENSITALQNRLSNSLVNLEFRIRTTQLSLASQKMIYEGFPKLAYLRIKGIQLNLENIELLSGSKISKIHYYTAHHDNASVLEAAMRKYYCRGGFSYGPGWQMDWRLTSPICVLRALEDDEEEYDEEQEYDEEEEAEEFDE